MFVKTTNGNLSKFPYTLGELREVDAPKVDSKTHRVVKGVENVGGVWTQTWTTQQLPEDRAAENVRGHRNGLLKETDWTGLSDTTMSAEMTTYRQALRDITDHENFPYLEDADWPIKPE